MSVKSTMNFVAIVFFLYLIAFTKAAGGGGGGMTSSNEDSQGGDTDHTKTLREKETLVLKCKLNTTEIPQIEWYKENLKLEDGMERVKIENLTLMITDSNEDDIGNYSCRSTNLSPQKVFNISVISLAYRKMPKSVTHFQGDPFNMTCEVEGNPTPMVEWTKDNNPINDQMFNASEYDLHYNLKGVPNAILEIKEAKNEHRGEYECHISSKGITVSTKSLVRVKDMYAALWPFLGICAEVIILCLIIFIYEKKRMKNDLDESDTDQPNEKNSSGSNTDVRQRK